MTVSVNLNRRMTMNDDFVKVRDVQFDDANVLFYFFVFCSHKKVFFDFMIMTRIILDYEKSLIFLLRHGRMPARETRAEPQSFPLF